jgi:hypothetical protein
MILLLLLKRFFLLEILRRSGHGRRFLRRVDHLKSLLKTTETENERTHGKKNTNDGKNSFVSRKAPKNKRDVLFVPRAFVASLSTW